MRQRKCWMSNIKEWTSLPMPELLTRTSHGEDWKRISAESSVVFPLTIQSVQELGCTELLNCRENTTFASWRTCFVNISVSCKRQNVNNYRLTVLKWLCSLLTALFPELWASVHSLLLGDFCLTLLWKVVGCVV